jgi:CheY-like chemotaxis protein
VHETDHRKDEFLQCACEQRRTRQGQRIRRDAAGGGGGAPAVTTGVGVATVELVDLRARVLVVDDNRDAAMPQALFDMENCKAATACDGHEAVLATEQAMPDMIAMDLGMPRMDGDEAARRIRRQPGSTQVPMVAVTGWGQRTMQAGFDHHLIKPVNFLTNYGKSPATG